jgi:hypothetical protein
LKIGDFGLEISKRKTNHRNQPSRVLIRNLVFLVFWVALFTLAYAQSPLYTSNQNQYFLHGFAQAGFGDLSEDWLANTLDPTPVFSKLIEISWRARPWRPIFYIYFGVLGGVYLFSLLRIANQLWGFGRSRPQKWLFLTTLLVLFSAGLRYLTARLLGLQWEFLFDGGVAGQRLLGTVFQPSTFGVFLLFSIDLFLRGKRGWAIVCSLIAVSFHPTYLLSAGILTAIYMGITFWETRDVRPSLALGVGALVGVSPILWQSLATFGGSKPMMAAQARKILVAFRIPHHAVVAEWLDASVLIKLGFIGVALVILWKGRAPLLPPSPKVKLFHIILWPSLIAIALTMLQVLTNNVTLALLFPWRLSTWLVPLSVGLAAGWVVRWLFKRFELARYAGWVIALSGVVAIIFAAIGIAKFQISWQEKVALGEQAMMAYVGANKQLGDTYLIPLKMQDFRLETGAPAYIEFKSIPYKDVEVIEWRRRVDLTRKFYARTRCKQIIELSEAEGFTHLVLPADHEAIGCQQVEAVYLDEAYGVYRVLSR